MSRPYTTICPHCGQEITVPYEWLSRHFHQERGRLSAAKRTDRRTHLNAMNRQRWDTYVYPKQEELLALATTVDLRTFPMMQIADHLGYVGRYRGVESPDQASAEERTAAMSTRTERFLSSPAY